MFLLYEYSLFYILLLSIFIYSLYHKNCKEINDAETGEENKLVLHF